MLWYWKIDIIVANQAQQTIGLEHLHQTLKEQNKILTELKAQLGGNANVPNAEAPSQ